jgi:hypothetical protein
LYSVSCAVVEFCILLSRFKLLVVTIALILFYFILFSFVNSIALAGPVSRFRAIIVATPSSMLQGRHELGASWCCHSLQGGQATITRSMEFIVGAWGWVAEK